MAGVQALNHRLRSSCLRTSCSLALLLSFTGALWADESQPRERWLPLFDDWFVEQGIELPRPYGVGATAIYMDRDVEVEDVRVSFGNRPPESIGDRADFIVRNSTGLLNARADAWILPFVNVYLMAGHTESEARLETTISIPNPGPGDPIEKVIQVDNDVSGTMLGAGITGVVGFNDWFLMADANYNEADLDEFEGELDVWIVSARIGRVFNHDHRQVMVWAGPMYVDSERTISIVSDLPIIGETRIDVDQGPTDPVTYQLGASVTLNKAWNFMFEAGTNFDDATLFIAGLTFRF